MKTNLKGKEKINHLLVVPPSCKDPKFALGDGEESMIMLWPWRFDAQDV